ncbi:MAG: ABC-2 type transport system ATP-binding protein [Paracoccaceae bacterium]|jgi:ABC-2 type transport system ATP-binding protein
MPEPAISVQNLHRSFDSLKAVDGVSFDVPHGSVCGFIGANGAGKTTTMRVIASLDYPSSGAVSVCGYDTMNQPEKVRRLIGWMPDHFGNYDNMTVLEYLDFYSRALGFKGTERQLRVQEVMEFVDLLPLADRFSNKLSKGMTQRLGLGRALLHDPQVLIMDEPAAGLDPKARVELKHLIRVLAEEGKTIFISSHILSELGQMCDHLLFMNDGKLVHEGDAESLRVFGAGAGKTPYSVHLVDPADQLVDWVAVNPHVEYLETLKKGARIEIDSTDPERAAQVLARMIADGLKVIEFHREERNLEEAFIDLLESTNKPVPEPLLKTLQES